MYLSADSLRALHSLIQFPTSPSGVIFFLCFMLYSLDLEWEYGVNKHVDT